MQSVRFVLALALTGLLPILAGQPPGESVRTPQPPVSVPPLLQQYDFGAQLRTLENSGRISSTGALSLPPIDQTVVLCRWAKYYSEAGRYSEV